VTVDAPLSLISIGNYAFSNCPNVSFLTQQFKKLKTIGQGAFMNTMMASAVVPENVEWIGDGAFSFDDNLKEMRCYAVVPPACESWAGPVSEDVYSICKLYVPKGSEAAYKIAEGWKQFFSINQTGEPKCATPTVSIEKGEMVFSCDTEDVEFHYSFAYPDSQDGVGSRVKLPQTVMVTVYASRKGLQDSEIAVYELPLGSGSGDVNGDGVVNIADISRIITIMAGF
jgi:hypothetical protein